MRRWHEDRDLMLARWRQEIAVHEHGFVFPVAAVPPEAAPGACHCYRGMGFLRKKRPLDCGRPRCGLCHPEKRISRRGPAQAQRALSYEWEASGGW
jgi:hypothetical protein